MVVDEDSEISASQNQIQDQERIALQATRPIPFGNNKKSLYLARVQKN